MLANVNSCWVNPQVGRKVAQCLAGVIPLVLGVLTLVFVLVESEPGSPADLPPFSRIDAIVLADGRDHPLGVWWISALPGIAIAATVITAILVGDGMRERLDLRVLERTV